LTEVTIDIEGINPVEFFGVKNAKLNMLKKAFPHLKILARGNKIKIAGNEQDIDHFKQKVDTMLQLLEKYGHLTDENVEDLLADADPLDLDIPGMAEDAIVYGPGGNVIRARTPNQKKLVEEAATNDIVFAAGPAGTGKTYTAVALAVSALKNNQVKKIILTRPAVEAGENLGFLPGDLKEKVDPYLRPLYDALDDMLPIEKVNYYTDNRIIEIAPLAFMRGRTLDNAFIILDEAQNASDPQLKMFLTRLGPTAKCIVTGDLTQVDLPKQKTSGLVNAINILKDIEGIGLVYLDQHDVIRHKLVKRIIDAYEKFRGADNKTDTDEHKNNSSNNGE
jgi:phosphate starvation-inducible PhoH-like protein